MTSLSLFLKAGEKVTELQTPLQNSSPLLHSNFTLLHIIGEPVVGLLMPLLKKTNKKNIQHSYIISCFDLTLYIVTDTFNVSIALFL